MARYSPEVRKKAHEYDEKAMRGKHFAEKRLQDENARRGQLFGIKLPSLLSMIKRN
jgi:hypothetical protein